MNQEEQELLLEARALLSEELPPRGDSLICECECVSLKDIRDFASQGSYDLDTLKRELNLGAGCASCVRSYETWKAKI